MTKLQEGKWVAKSLDGKERRFKDQKDADYWRTVHSGHVTPARKSKTPSLKDYLQRLEDEAEAERQASRPTSLQIWSKFHAAVGEVFPDGDPIDRLAPWMRQHDLTMHDIDAAVKEHGGAEDAHSYLAQMWDDYSSDAEHDAAQGAYGETYDNQWFQRPNPWK